MRVPSLFRSALLVAAAALTAGCEDEGPLQLTAAVLRHPEVLDFGAIPVGVGRSLTFTVENVGNGPASVLGFGFESSRARVEVSPERFFVVSGDAVEVMVRYTPLGLSSDPVELPLEMVTDLPGDAAARTLTLVGRGVRQGLSFSPEPLDFGRVLRGRTSTRTVTVTSLLPEPAEILLLDIESGSSGGRFEVFRAADDEPGSLGRVAPGESRDLRIRYTPARLGPEASDRAVLPFAFCPDAARCRSDLALRGEAVTVPLDCQPDPVDFGAVRAARSRSELVACLNQTQRRLVVDGARADPADGVAFALPLSAPRVLAPGARETFEVRAAVEPGAEVGLRSSRAFLASFDEGSGLRAPEQPVGLRLRVGDAALRWSPQAVDFGRVAVGQEATARLVLENVGTEVLNVAILPLEAPFAVETGALALGGGETTELRLRFTPTGPGPAAGVLRLETDAPEQQDVEILLGGRGLVLPPCVSRLEPPNVDFGRVALRRTVTRGAQIRNVGPDPCLVREGALGETTPADFQLVEGGEQDVLLEPGEAWTFVIAYRPQRFGDASGTLSAKLSSDAPPVVTFQLEGSGVSAPTLVLAPDEVDFGEQDPSCVGRRTIEVFNPGPGRIDLTGLRLVSANLGSSPFALADVPSGLAAGGVGLSLEAGDGFSFAVSYQPASANDRAVARVELTRSDQASPVAVSLFAKGSLDPFITEGWRQAGFGAVDILLVIDNSSSMGAEQQALQASFPRFLNYARNRGFDYRIGVVTTDAEGGSVCPETGVQPPPDLEDGACGYLSEGSGLMRRADWRLVDPSEQPSPEEAFRYVSDVGTSGAAAEAGLRSATLALEPTRLAGWNAGLLSRPDAFLSVLFLSDEDDQSPGNPRMYEAMLAATKGARFRDRFALSGIVIDPVGCGAGFTSRYLDAIARSGGTAGSICATSYDDVIDRLARAAAGLRDRFVLRRPAYSPSVSVVVDGVPLSAVSQGKRRWRFDGEGNAVVFESDGVPREGSAVEVRYRPRCFDP